MQHVHNQWILTPSDIVDHIECEYRTWLNLQVLNGTLPAPSEDDAQSNMLSRLGNEFEQSYRTELESQNHTIWQAQPWGSLKDRWESSRQALMQGIPVLYQPTLWINNWVGTPDFLIKRTGSSRLGSFLYEVTEVKLAHHARVSALVQATFYSLLLEDIQGVAAPIRLVLGNASTLFYPQSHAAAYVQLAGKRLKDWIERAPSQEPTYPELQSACATCSWLSYCEKRRRDDDHLGYIANITHTQINKLKSAGIHTLTDLARHPSPLSVSGIGEPTLIRLKKQAELQLEERLSGEITYQLLPYKFGDGLDLLPEPSAGDVYFDFEGDPLAEGGSLEYLFGWAEVTKFGEEPIFHALWAHNRIQERNSFSAFITRMMERLKDYPDMHIYHYAPYEPTALKRLMGRHGIMEAEVDHLLRRHIFVDLYQIVRHSLMISKESYSIKSLEPLYMPTRNEEITNAGASIVAYDQWKHRPDSHFLRQIEDYNRADCLSTWRLHQWLLDRKREVVPLREPYAEESRADDDITIEPETDVVYSLASQLTQNLIAEPNPSDPGYPLWVMAHLLNWHRREEKSQWWKHFSHLEMTAEELMEDSEALGYLEFVGKSPQGFDQYRYREQEHKIKAGDNPLDPATGKSAGTVVHIDPLRNLIVIKPPRNQEARPEALIPGKPVPTQVLKLALQRIAEEVIRFPDTRPGPFRALRRLLWREPPGLATDPLPTSLRRQNEDAVQAARRLALSLDHQYLAIQGPPGSGKSYTASHIVVDLVSKGKTVGITAPSHQVVSHLLESVLTRARESHSPLKAVQKAQEHQGVGAPEVQLTGSNAQVAKMFQQGIPVVAGTPWLFARPEWQQALDVLVIDEAGQISLAQALAAGQSANSVILLGDPQQLRQPSQGHHPPGIDVSVLEYLLNGCKTIDERFGIFLNVTRRMHPRVTEYISAIAYDNKLVAHEACARQRLGGRGLVSGSGLYYLPLWHQANRTASSEEAHATAWLIDELVGRLWTDQQGRTRPLGASDILVVAPYNAQITRLHAVLPSTVRIGTVDKFQGQEAPVVIYNTTASSAEEVPHGLEFLYSLNRLNVAISRAQGIAIMVGSPSLLFHKPKDAEQLALINALCTFVERAIILPDRNSETAVPSAFFSSPAFSESFL